MAVAKSIAPVVEVPPTTAIANQTNPTVKKVRAVGQAGTTKLNADGLPEDIRALHHLASGRITGFKGWGDKKALTKAELLTKLADFNIPPEEVQLAIAKSTEEKAKASKAKQDKKANKQP